MLTAQRAFHYGSMLSPSLVKPNSPNQPKNLKAPPWQQALACISSAEETKSVAIFGLTPTQQTHTTFKHTHTLRRMPMAMDTKLTK